MLKYGLALVANLFGANGPKLTYFSMVINTKAPASICSFFYTCLICTTKQATMVLVKLGYHSCRWLFVVLFYLNCQRVKSLRKL